MRWSSSIHSQVESLYASIRSVGESRVNAEEGNIRGIGTWDRYRKEAHYFANYCKKMGIKDLRDAKSVEDAAKSYLNNKLSEAIIKFETGKRGGMFTTQETRSAAMSSFERAYNTFFEKRGLENRIDLTQTKQAFLDEARKKLGDVNHGRAYLAPQSVVAAIKDPTHRLQAEIQLHSGCRAEGVGAPSGKIANPMTARNLKGTTADPITGKTVGVIETREKGGKWTVHYIPTDIYDRLSSHIKKYGKLESIYKAYLTSVNNAAEATGQYKAGRGSHGFKYCFVQARYADGVKRGLSHEYVAQQTQKEASHFRIEEQQTYQK